MFYDIFSVFDDHNFVFIGLVHGLWFFVIFSCFCFLSFFWVCGNLFFGFVRFLFSVVGGLVNSSVGKNVGGSSVLFCSLFFFLIVINIFGLVPYVFSVTRHLCINLSIAFPFWLRIVLMSMFYDLVGFFSHLQPLGSPVFLSPFLCLIELVRNFVRPLTLCVRLTANLRTGHILVGLLGTGFLSTGSYLMVLIFLFSLFYFIFELGVCFVQSYIFTLLPTLYVDEHPVLNH